MKKTGFTRALLGAAALALALTMLAGCAAQPQQAQASTQPSAQASAEAPAQTAAPTPAQSAAPKSTVKIGSKNFTENFLVAELYALALENAGYKVERTFGISNPQPALLAGDIDLYPEYTGTGLMSVLKLPALTDPDEVYKTVKDTYKKQFNLVWLDSSKAEDSSCIVMLKAKADELGIKTLTDLNKHAPELKLADFQGWSEREDNLKAMNKLYGEFKFKELVTIDAGLKYQALDKDEVQVVPGLTTEPQLLDSKYVVIQEDIKVWPPYFLAPVVRQDTLDKNPDIAAILNKVSASLDTPKLISLISSVDIDGKAYEDVAKDYFDKTLK